MPKKIQEEVTLERNLDVRKCDSYGNYEVYRINGGVVPKELHGVYTGATKAQTALDCWNATQGFINESKRLKEEIKSITPLDHTYDEV